MHARPLALALLLFSGFALAQQPTPRAPEAPAPNPKLAGYATDGGRDKAVYQIPIDGTIDLGLAPFVERVVDQARANDVVLVRIKTFGGRVDAAVRIRDALLASPAPTICYVDRRAISAGALISLACDTIVMSPGASIGAATPVQLGQGGDAQPTSEKVVSYLRAEFRATAEAKGRRGDIAEAMVDPEIEIKDVSPKGKLLTLTSEEALKLKLADAVADDYGDVFALLNLQAAERVQAATHWAEKVARILTDPVVSSLLMTIGVLGLLFEFYTPGFGAGGIAGILCLGLFFGGQYAANLAGWEELLLFIVGFALLLVEAFVIPGFGVTGIVGIVVMTAALVMSLMELELPWDVSYDLGYLQQALRSAAIRIAVLIVAVIAGAVLFGKHLPGSVFGRLIILSSDTAAAAGYVSQAAAESTLLGKRGRTMGALRPAGIATIDGKRVDVVAEGSYIDSNTEIEVVQVDGNRVVVKQVIHQETNEVT